MKIPAPLDLQDAITEVGVSHYYYQQVFQNHVKKSIHAAQVP